MESMTAVSTMVERTMEQNMFVVVLGRADTEDRYFDC